MGGPLVGVGNSLSCFNYCDVIITPDTSEDRDIYTARKNTFILLFFSCTDLLFIVLFDVKRMTTIISSEAL